MKNRIFGAFFFLLVLFQFPSLSAGETAKNWDEEEVMYGFVVSASQTNIVMREYALDQDKEVQQSYIVTPETMTEGVNSILDLKPGDEVEIFYTLKDGNRLALNIAKDEIDAKIDPNSTEEAEANALEPEALAPANTAQP
ncbi:MAG: hypothetical protein HQL23_07455 [Candidatus Omnitrophica bacterium]|nr:hypothetical protein [Candidatus Omnitrophota bacterium]